MLQNFMCERETSRTKIRLVTRQEKLCSCARYSCFDMAFHVRRVGNSFLCCMQKYPGFWGTFPEIIHVPD